MVRNIFSCHWRTSAASRCVPGMVVRLSMIWRGKMSQCHLPNWWVNILQQAAALHLPPRRAELSFQGHTAAPVHLPGNTHTQPWGTQWVRCAAGSVPPCGCSAWAHAVRKSQPQPCKPRTRQLTRAGGGPCRNRSHSPSAGVTGPWDLSLTSYPGRAGLAWHLFLLHFLYPGPRHCYGCWQSYLLPCTSTVPPGKLQRREKVMSNETASLSLLIEDRYGLTMPFQRKKTFISQLSVYL